MARCTRCGREIDEDTAGSWNPEQGYAYCEPCEEAHQEFLREQFPFGQCQECGAVGFEWTRPSTGKIEIRFHHAEGQCRHWRDYAGEEE